MRAVAVGWVCPRREEQVNFTWILGRDFAEITFQRIKWGFTFLCRPPARSTSHQDGSQVTIFIDNHLGLNGHLLSP